MDFNTATFWIQANGLHFARIRIVNVEKFSNLIGKLVQNDKKIRNK